MIRPGPIKRKKPIDRAGVGSAAISSNKNVGPVVVNPTRVVYGVDMTHQTTTGPTARKESDMDSTPTTTYDEACAHAEANYVSTNGLVCGGTYRVAFDDGAHLVDLRVGVSGIARPAR